MKRFRLTIITIMLTFVFASNLNTSWALGMEQSDYIKVGLKYESSAAQYYTIKADEGFVLGTASGNGFTEGMPLPAYTSIIVTTEYGAVVLKDENGTLLSADLGSSGIIMPANYQNEGIIYLDNTPYRGGIMLIANSNGTITAINYIPLEHYIYGVLNAELHHTNPMEALKAQAVAARSFGALSKGKHSSNGFDVCQTTHCQVYKGYSGEYAATNRAVDETSGEMIYSGGKPVTAFYFKNSGGYTQNVEDVWSYRQPYLRGVKDSYSPSYPWDVSLSFDTIKQKLEASGYSPGVIRSVAIKSRNASGNISDLEIVGSNGTINLQKEKIRNVLGATVIKSLMFTLGDKSGNALADSKIIASNGSTTTNLGSDVYMISGDGRVSKQTMSIVYALNYGSPVKLYGDVVDSEIVTGGTVIFKGYGYGHGVGMPQDSAIEMAKQGYAYDKILKQYYTDIEIK